jgi:hypothetical protein
MPTYEGKQRQDGHDPPKGRTEKNEPQPGRSDESADPLDDDQADSGPDRDHEDLGS